MQLLPKDNLELMLQEFGVADFGELMKKRVSNERVIKLSPFAITPRRVSMTESECKKLCEKNGLRYSQGYENRIIERVTTTEEPDRYGDIVRAKGIDNTNYRKNAVILFAHNHGDFPVGKSLKEWIDKEINGWRSWDLYFDDEVDPTGKSDLTFRMVDSGAMPGGSIGFMPLQSIHDHTPEERAKLRLGKFGVEYISVEKLEHSACSVPANPEALSNCLKSIEHKRLISIFNSRDIDRMAAEKMLDEKLLDIFKNALGPTKTISIPAITPVEKDLEVYKPYPNEHAARVRDPGDFIEDSMRSKDITDGVRMIIGKLKDGDDSMVTQAYRFSVDKFTAEEAKKWLEDNDVEYISFEEAAEKGIKQDERNVMNFTLNLDLAETFKKLELISEQIKVFNTQLLGIHESFKSQTDALLAATQRALAMMEQRTKTTSLYDRKELEDALKLPKR